MIDVIQKIVEELKITRPHVEGAVALLNEDATVPFIARYRKEKTGGLDEVQIAAIKDRLRYLKELEERRAAVLKAIHEAGKMTPELQAKIESAPTKAELEDLYIPYRARRRTRSTAARQKGLEPLSELIWKQETASGSVEELVKPFIDAEKGVKDMGEALAGARDIIAERIAEDAACRKIARDQLVNAGKVTAKAREGVDLARTKFAGYAHFSELLTKIPSHRILAVMRGSSEKQLAVVLEAPREQIVNEIKARIVTNPDSIFKPELAQAVEDAYDRLLGPSMDNELRQELKRRADLEAIEVFAKNLRALLLQAPLGEKPVLAIDPGLRTGCKVAVLDVTGKLLMHTVIFPEKNKKPEAKPAAIAAVPAAISATPPGTESSSASGNGTEVLSATATVDAVSIPPAPAESGQKAPEPAAANEAHAAAAATLVKLVQEHGIKAIAIGNGTGGREADVFVRGVLRENNLADVIRVIVNESGASIYSASPAAREEFPNLDITARGTVSIGRRLQDPLAELVKLDPKSIGVGQYQHDVDQSLLMQKLEEVVESCVNHVGVDVNTASAALLRYVAGIGPAVAKNVVETRNAKGSFRSRDELREVPGLGVKSYEQCAGFLRIRNSLNPLDNSAVHPESYAVAEQMAGAVGCALKDLIGNEALIQKIEIEKFKNDQFGEFTLKDIVAELKKPGRDPRSTFVNPEFNDEVREVKDLKEGLVLNGVVTNLTAFGAFVDIGVHQDGLVHISAITYKFIRDPSEALTVGQHVKVKVLGVDADRKRISLSIKALQEAPAPRPARARTEARPRAPRAETPAGAPGAPSTGTAPAGAPRGAAAGNRSGSAQGGRSRFQGRPQRPARPPSSAAPGQPGPAGTPSAQAASSMDPAAANLAARGSRERSFRDNKDRAARPGAPRSERRDGRPSKPAPAPGAPDFSKFFVKSKRKDKERKKQDVSGASREEVREVLRSQKARGTSLGDLLKQAGVGSEESQ